MVAPGSFVALSANSRPATFSLSAPAEDRFCANAFTFSICVSGSTTGFFPNAPSESPRFTISSSLGFRESGAMFRLPTRNPIA